MKRLAAALCAVSVVAVVSGCGGEDFTPASGTPMPTPTPTATPGPFAGTYVGMVTLDAGRTAAVSLTVHGGEQATGTLTISGSGMADTVVPLTGLVDQIGGTFSMTGDDDTVSGTLPGSSGGDGFLSVQIGTNTNPFHGTIHAA